jgi:hypothetical protein
MKISITESQLELLKENIIVNDWKVINVGMNNSGFYTVSRYSSGSDSLSMFSLTLTVLYSDDYIDPMADFDGDVSYFDDDIKERGILNSHDFIGYSSNTPTRNYVTDIKFNVVDGSVDFNNPNISYT